jgi:zinc transport system ATP-binding protein
MKKQPIISVNNVSFGYTKTPVIEEANFDVHAKDYIAVIGPNGGGKSTMIKLILGLLEPDEGSISVFGDSPSKAAGKIGYVPQHFHFDFDFPMRVLDVVLMGRLGHRGLFKRYTEKDKQLCLESLKKVGMDELINRQISELSGGQRQRVLIARALVTNPKLLILDEPASGIDVKWQEELHLLLRELNKKITILIISHHIEIICDHISKVLFVNRDVHLHESVADAVKHLGEVYGFTGTFTLKNICH